MQIPPIFGHGNRLFFILIFVSTYSYSEQFIPFSYRINTSDCQSEVNYYVHCNDNMGFNNHHRCRSRAAHLSRLECESSRILAQSYSGPQRQQIGESVRPFVDWSGQKILEATEWAQRNMLILFVTTICIIRPSKWCLYTWWLDVNLSCYKCNDLSWCWLVPRRIK